MHFPIRTALFLLALSISTAHSDPGTPGPASVVACMLAIHREKLDEGGQAL